MNTVGVGEVTWRDKVSGRMVTGELTGTYSQESGCLGVVRVEDSAGRPYDVALGQLIFSGHDELQTQFDKLQHEHERVLALLETVRTMLAIER